MAKKSLPDPEFLRKLLRYDPDAGKLFWRDRPRDMFCSDRIFRSWNARFSGAEALTAINKDGYRRGLINKKDFVAHRVMWAIFHGEWPQRQIDHINGNRTDNRLNNLRVVSNKTNCRNQRRRKTNSSGVMGVSWFARDRCWRAAIKVNGKTIHLGYYQTLSEAKNARELANKKFGFHENHGR